MQTGPTAIDRIENIGTLGASDNRKGLSKAFRFTNLLPDSPKNESRLPLNLPQHLLGQAPLMASCVFQRIPLENPNELTTKPSRLHLQSSFTSPPIDPIHTGLWHSITTQTPIIHHLIIPTIRHYNLRQLIPLLPLQTRTHEARVLPRPHPVRDPRVSDPIGSSLVVLARDVNDRLPVGFGTALGGRGAKEAAGHIAVYLVRQSQYQSDITND